jgi:hypothetical protein
MVKGCNLVLASKSTSPILAASATGDARGRPAAHKERRYARPTSRLLLSPTRGDITLVAVASHAQSFNGSVSGTVTDPSGSPVAAPRSSSRATAPGSNSGGTPKRNGAYAFRNLVPGYYQLTTEVTGFQTYVRKGIQVALNGEVRLDVTLSVGTQSEEIEVVGASPMMYDTGAKEDGIAPETLQNLPLMFTSGPRSSATFVMLMPGVATGGTANAFDARINGGMQAGDEAVLDGASMQQAP